MIVAWIPHPPAELRRFITNLDYDPLDIALSYAALQLALRGHELKQVRVPSVDFWHLHRRLGDIAITRIEPRVFSLTLATPAGPLPVICDIELDEPQCAADLVTPACRCGAPMVVNEKLRVPTETERATFPVLTKGWRGRQIDLVADARCTSCGFVGFAWEPMRRR